MIGVHIAHDCVLGNDITIANAVGLSGFVRVEDKAVIGGMVGVHQFVRIGKLSMTGGVSKVNSDIPPFSICDGNPVKFYGVNSIGLKRDGYSSKETLEIKKALKILFSSGLKYSTAMQKVKEEVKSNADIEHLLEFVTKSERGISRSKRGYE
jgi:UDP-N-acetylglucosamine acyltransferase